MSLFIIYYGYQSQVSALGSDQWRQTVGRICFHLHQYRRVKVLFYENSRERFGPELQNIFSWRNYNRDRTNRKACCMPPVLYLLSDDLEPFSTFSLYFQTVSGCKFCDWFTLMLRSHLNITVGASYNIWSTPAAIKAPGQQELQQTQNLEHVSSSLYFKEKRSAGTGIRRPQLSSGYR